MAQKVEKRRLRLGDTLFTGKIKALWGLSMGVVSFLSLVPGVESPLEFTYGDKVGHALAYFWLAILPILGLEDRKDGITGALLMVLLGIVLEFVQALIPGRAPSYWDVLANCLGVAIGMVLAIRVRAGVEGA